MISQIIFAILVLLFVISFSPAHAQHHSGSLAPAIDFDGLKVALITILTPEGFTFEDDKSANLLVRFFDSDTNVNIKSVTYRVQIFQGENLVANQYFFDEDGQLEIQIKPTKGCQEENLWKCTKYFGEKHPIAGAYYARGDSIPVIQGPVFDKGGQYNIKVSIVGATNPKTMTTEDLLFETLLTIPQKNSFFIKTANAQEFPVSIKSYDDEISNFSFDELSNKISYDVIFKNEHNQQHSFENKQIISFLKDLKGFEQGYEIVVLVDGIKLKRNFYEFDSSHSSENIIKINIPHEELLIIENRKENDDDKNVIKIEILRGDQIVLHHLDYLFENNYSAKVSWDSKLTSGEKIPFTFSFFDNKKTPIKNVLFAYSVTDSFGNEIWSNIGNTENKIGIFAPNGIIQDSVFIRSDGQYQMKLILTGQNSKNFETFFTSKLDFSIFSQPVEQEQPITRVPLWVKNNAGWWATNQIRDTDFLGGVEYLIKENILKIESDPLGIKKDTSQEVPSWVKNNAGWWAEELISEDDFISGIQFLVEQGIIKVG